ncbi:unnamed protein product [Ostreobium quekettii]|uniref:Protein-S-isoprenylcysteine O-methyltransferase n=1 Tax=Ostreobium quekettii TaxID=121088 RepID=A0A8S1J9L5_9CHLO|nr:unnamed protein product [Ostreobium quekettii]
MLPQLPLPVQIFAAAVIFFHLSEFALAAIYMRSSLSWTSFLISTPYCVAMALALAEYTIEAALVPAMKEQLVIWVGLALVVVGDAIRKTAMAAGFGTMMCCGFPSHPRGYCRQQLHARAIEGASRGAQACFSWDLQVWKFFSLRTEIEESHLRDFFPGEYDEYVKKVPTGVPGWPGPSAYQYH